MKLRPFLRIDEELSLHLARPELAGPVFAVVDAHRAYLREWLPWVDPTKTEEDTNTFIRESMQHNTNGTRLTTFILSGEEVAGSLGVVLFNRDHKKCEVGYWLREDLQGRGIMTKALACFCEHLFTAKSMNRIEILIASGNERSKGVPKRLGFKMEGVLRQALFMYGKYYNVELYSLLKDEWVKKVI
ncbi:MAG: GNAT family N-acetyltransferase [Lewinellaceae bacterium]|nr:GNAT family N-acetyltransferase [Lewinellaceae bacterium]